MSDVPLEKISADWVNLLVGGEFDQAVTSFDATVSKQINAVKLKEIWDSITTQFGAFKGIKSIKTSPFGDYIIAFVTSNFANSVVDIQLTLNTEGKIAGLFFRPSTENVSYNPPEYVATGSFTETEVTIGAGKWLLPGTLTIPKSGGPFPALVLVHGSGPNDRDETIVPNKPFKDLAWGLASRGIAVLRYEKRTKQYGPEFASVMDTFTVEDEVIADALAAVTLLSTTKGIDSQRIFVLGHSLGGMLAPRIAAQDNRLAGIIILAGLTRKLEDTILEQVTYIAMLDGTIDSNEAAQIKTLEQQVKKVKELDFSPGEVFLGSGKAYWQDMAKYSPVATAKNLTLPMLVLQGERDYQVTMVDFKAWADGLKGRNNVVLKSYPDLNHLFMTGTGKSTPAEYSQPSHINKCVIKDIADWITSQS